MRAKSNLTWFLLLGVSFGLGRSGGQSLGGPNQATFVSIDAATLGNWKAAGYGRDGYQIANDSTNLPTYAAVNISNANRWTWNATTADPRALIDGSGSNHIASTWFSWSNFNIDINLKDGMAHQVALYSLDWDQQGRAQSFTLRDADTGLILDLRQISHFGGGMYLVWTITGHVNISITKTGISNAVVSGLFVGPSTLGSSSSSGGSGTPSTPPVNPAISLTGPANAQTVAGIVSVAATTSSTITGVQFKLDGSNLGPIDLSSPYAYAWDTTATTNGPHQLSATATSSDGTSTTSSSIVVTVSNAATTSQATATFLKLDVTTEGTWQSAFGRDGYITANDSISIPSYAQVNMSHQASWTWNSSTNDVRALQRPSWPSRIASTWYDTLGFSIDLSFTDGKSHSVAVYCLDWDFLNRVQTLEVVDATSGKVLDSRNLTSFSEGVYVAWNLSGHVLIRATKSNGANAVISGMFFGTPLVISPPPAPAVTLSFPANGQTVSGTINISAAASSSSGLAGVQFTLDNTNLGAFQSLAPFTLPWNTVNLPNGSHTLTAIASDRIGQTTTSGPVSVTINNVTAQPQNASHHYLYVATAPDYHFTTPAVINVYDIDNGHKLVKTIPLPGDVMGIRGIWANIPNNKLYISHYGSTVSNGAGKLLALDLTTNGIAYETSFSVSAGQSGVDRGCILPNGSRIYLPTGEENSTNYWYSIDPLTGLEDPIKRVHHWSGTHNTICSLDGSTVFMAAIDYIGAPSYEYTIKAFQVATGSSTTIGPFSGRVRPFTVDTRRDLVFVNLEDFVGFEVAQISTGTVLYSRVQPPGYAEPAPNNAVPSHGIALTPNGNEVWVSDAIKNGIHIWDVSNLPSQPPTYKTFIPTAWGPVPNYGQPGWILTSIDGKYMYPETMEVIDTQTHTIVGQLYDQFGNPMHSRYGIEVDFTNGIPSSVGDQFGIAR